MRLAALAVLLVSVVPRAASAQLPPDPNEKPQSKILSDVNVTLGAVAIDHKTITTEAWSFAGQLSAAGSVMFVGRPNAALGARAALDLAFPFNVPSMLSFGFGFAWFPVKDSNTFLRLTVGPTVFLNTTGDLGLQGAFEFHIRRLAGIAFVGGLGGFFHSDTAPSFRQDWGARATLGAAFDFKN
jgi:hypothetical protein